LQIATVDVALYDRNYAIVQGFISGMSTTGIGWREVASTDAAMRSDIEKIKTMLRQNPDIQVLWSGTNPTTEIAIKAVQEMNLQKKVAVFGVLDTSRSKLEMLLDPKNPLHAITDERGRESTKRAMETILTVLNQKGGEYQIQSIESRTLVKKDVAVARSILVSERPRVGNLDRIPVIPNMAPER
jgi:ABC-type sugar transport system substrate-binding protein